MLDMRYHWLTLTALFFALGLGIAIGVSLGERGTLAEEQARLAERLQQHLSELREENRSLRQAERRLEAALQEAEGRAELIARAAVEGRLAGRTFLLTVPRGEGTVPVAAGPDPVRRWRMLLERAGATVLPEDGETGALAVEDVEAWAAADGSRAGSPGTFTAIYINPPSNLLIPDGWRGAVVWDGPPEDTGMEGVLPSHWFSLRAGPDAFAEWAFVEGLYRGWQGFVDAVAEDGERSFPWDRWLGEERDGR